MRHKALLLAVATEHFRTFLSCYNSAGTVWYPALASFVLQLLDDIEAFTLYTSIDIDYLHQPALIKHIIEINESILQSDKNILQRKKCLSTSLPSAPTPSNAPARAPASATRQSSMKTT